MCANVPPRLQLVPAAPDTDTVDTLTRLLALAKAGKVVGLAFVALHQGTGYEADVTGITHQHPLFTLGVCRALEAAVSTQTRKK